MSLSGVKRNEEVLAFALVWKIEVAWMLRMHIHDICLIQHPAILGLR
jgi:hypothetical protein